MNKYADGDPECPSIFGSFTLVDLQNDWNGNNFVFF